MTFYSEKMNICTPFLLILNLFIVSCSVDGKLLAVEPLVVVKSLVQDSTDLQSLTWEKLKDINETSTHTPAILTAIDNMVQSRAVLKINEDYITTLSLPSGAKLDTPINIPYPNTLTLLSTALDYLLDGFDPEVLQKPLKDMEFADNIVVPKNMGGNTLLELINKVPQYNIEQIGLVNEMNLQARTTFLVVRDLLSKHFRDGWNDAFVSISMDNAVLTEEMDVEAPLNDIAMFTQSTLLDWNNIKALPVDKMSSSIRGNSFAFGWWLNCERGQSCLVDVLPRDTIISFSPALRIYIIPSIGTGFVIANTVQTGHNSRTMRDLLNFDSELFARMLRVVETKEEHTNAHTDDSDDVSPDSSNDSQSPEDNFLDMCYNIVKKWVLLYMDFASQQYLIVRVMLWMVFLFVAHMCTAWMYHGLWWVMCRLVKRTHDPRPKIE